MFAKHVQKIIIWRPTAMIIVAIKPNWLLLADKMTTIIAQVLISANNIWSWPSSLQKYFRLSKSPVIEWTGRGKSERTNKIFFFDCALSDRLTLSLSLTWETAFLKALNSTSLVSIFNADNLSKYWKFFINWNICVNQKSILIASLWNQIISEWKSKIVDTRLMAKWSVKILVQIR